MGQGNTPILANLIDTSSPKAILAGARNIFSVHYPGKYYKEIEKCYKQIRKLFEGKFQGYNICNTEYHNLSHTLSVFLATIRLIDGYNLTEVKFPNNLVINLLKASLFHDTGYIQEKWDNDGTGAKHTESHIGRSIAFLIKHKGDFGIHPTDVDVISKVIRCTELKCNLNTIPFSSDVEKCAGWILGTADILGQMSDREYLERLLFLYHEVKEAGLPGYKTEFDIIKSTLNHYELVKKRLNNSFKRVYDYSEDHFATRYNIKNNLYIDAIEKNIAYIEKIINDTSTNFRHKLKRGNLIDSRVLLPTSNSCLE